MGLAGLWEEQIKPWWRGRRAALKAAGKTDSEIVVYPQADHGFLADYRASYNEAAATDAWMRAKAWFKRNLK